MASIVERTLRGAGFAAAAALVAGGLLYVLEANSSNWLVGSVLDVSRWLATPFRGIFDLDENKAQVIINWGIGAVAYVLAGVLLAALVAKLVDRAGSHDGVRGGAPREA